MKGMVDVCVGPMSSEDIGREISHYLNSCKQPSKMVVKIERQELRYFVRIYIPIKDFQKSSCDYSTGVVCPHCLSIQKKYIDDVINLFDNL